MLKKEKANVFGIGGLAALAGGLGLVAVTKTSKFDNLFKLLIGLGIFTMIGASSIKASDEDVSNACGD